MNQNLNPMQLFAMIKQNGPRQVAMQLAQSMNNPSAMQLIQMAENGDIQNLEKIVGNMFSSQGKNLSAEMQNLLSQGKLFQGF